MKLKINNTEIHEVDTKPLTLICHPDNVKVDPAEPVLMIEPSTTVDVTKNLSAEAWESLRRSGEFVRLWKYVFPDAELPEDISIEGLGYQHVVGLILMLWYAQESHQTPYIRFPETYLHPKAQLGLADLLRETLQGFEADAFGVR